MDAPFMNGIDILSHSHQDGAYFVVQVNPDTAAWLNGATAASVNANDFRIMSQDSMAWIAGQPPIRAGVV